MLQNQMNIVKGIMQSFQVNFMKLLVFCSVLALGACFGSQAPAPFHHYGEGRGAGSSGMHSVVLGDSLWSISKRYNVEMRDLIIKNQLKAPYRLRVGNRIKISSPKVYVVKSGDSLYSISRVFGVDMNKISKINRLSSPYVIHEGDVLNLPVSSYRNNNFASSKKEIIPKSVVKRSKIVEVPPKSSGRFMRPVNGRLISSYGGKKGGLHNDGINISVPRGTVVKSAENGVVAYVGGEIEGYGNLILVRHENRLMTAYAHLDSISVKKGQKVIKGDMIGRVGSTGGVDVPQLHFEIRKGTKALNPAKYL